MMVLLQVSWVVEVRPVHYLLARAATGAAAWTSAAGRSELPRGGTVEVAVSGHDSLGRRFHAAHLDIAFRPSRFDLIQINRLR
jgi:hypothetical protein